MHHQTFCLIICSIAVRTVTSINIEGPPLTIYRPCGLSLLYFNKTNDNTWQGVLDIPDQNTSKADIVISFKEGNTLRLPENSHNVTVHATNDHTINIHAELPVLKPVKFEITLNDLKHKVPFIAVLTLNDETICNDEIKSTLKLSAPVDAGYFKEFQDVCGKRSTDHEELMSLRTEAKAGDWPWAVAVYHSNSNTYVGGGSIISHTAVITSAFILLNTTASTIFVIAGTSNLADASQTGRQTVQATELIMHPGYRNDIYNIDNIGIIKVKQLTFSDYIKPLCIGEPHYGKTSSVVVVGFGNPLNHSGPIKTLKSIDTEIQTVSECRKTFPEFNEKLNICGGYGPTSNLNPTRGDSGNGLVVSSTGHDQKTTWFLRGILIGCIVKNGDCDPSKYAVYTNIGMYLGWMKELNEENSFN